MKIGNIAFLLVAAFVAALTWMSASTLTPERIDKDAEHNTRIAYNLVHAGEFSLDNEQRGYPATSYREPLPIYFMAAHIALHPALRTASIEEILEGPGAVEMKQHNLLWTFLCMLGLAAAAGAATRHRILGAAIAAAAIWWAYNTAFARGQFIDQMLTEVQAATFVAWAGATTIMALRTRRWFWFAATGVLVAALALTKAVFVFVGVGLIVALLAAYMWKPFPEGRARSALLVGVLALGFVTTLAPWLARNAMEFGRAHIAERGGIVLLVRAFKDQMTDDEFVGGFYHWAPNELKTDIGEWLGYSARDAEAGGRLQRLNRNGNAAVDRAAERLRRPEMAISFYGRSRAERTKAIGEFEAAGAENPSVMADAELQRRAVRMIMADPLRHLMMSILFLWRGTAFLALPLIIMAAAGLIRRDPSLIGLSIVTAGGAAVLALTTHFLPRYYDPLLPTTYLALIFMVFTSVAWLLGRVYTLAQPRFSLPPLDQLLRKRSG